MRWSIALGAMVGAMLYLRAQSRQPHQHQGRFPCIQSSFSGADAWGGPVDGLWSVGPLMGLVRGWRGRHPLEGHPQHCNERQARQSAAVHQWVADEAVSET